MSVMLWVYFVLSNQPKPCKQCSVVFFCLFFWYCFLSFLFVLLFLLCTVFVKDFIEYVVGNFKGAQIYRVDLLYFSNKWLTRYFQTWFYESNLYFQYVTWFR